MIKKIVPRLIPRLDIKGPNLIKGINLEGVRIVGNPNACALKYYKDGADELLLMDNVASLYGRNNLTNVISEAAKNIFIPITVGGGIRSIADAHNILRAGADKIAVNTAAVKKPKFVQDLAKIFGSQCISVSIETKKIKNGKWEIFTHHGRDRTGIELSSWIQKVIKLGAGEIILTSIDHEGVKNGFDLELINEVSKKCTVPLIISGGMGIIDHIDEILIEKNIYVDGISVASVLHYNLIKLPIIKKRIEKVFQNEK
tara:strand:- start:398 stop:1168 length:771 start_codon:yes stop_codon:yes gene_type:complete